jgi:hypothetical protein
METSFPIDLSRPVRHGGSTKFNVTPMQTHPTRHANLKQSAYGSIARALAQYQKFDRAYLGLRLYKQLCTNKSLHWSNDT